ncbi:MAG: nucleoside phosphorylase [Candidatus Bathyarchaeia archaeon]
MDEAIFNPSDFIRYVARNRGVAVETIVAPHRLLLTYQRATYESAKELIDGKAVDWWFYGDVQPFCVGRFNDVEIGVGRFWIGAPAATMTLEELIVCGAKTIFEVGLAGGLQDFLKPGDIVVATEAIRDEGTSHHYLPPETKVYSSARLREGLVDSLKRKAVKHFVGPVWSTDAVYRETRNKFRGLKNGGVLAVDMETSAILALAKYRNVEAASAQVISDVLTETGWLQAWQDQSLREGTQVLLRTVFEVLSKS